MHMSLNQAVDAFMQRSSAARAPDANDDKL
jgi:hypothetical protein